MEQAWFIFMAAVIETVYWKQRHQIPDKGQFSQSYGFSSSHVWIWELHHKESWALRKWCLWIAVLKKTLESLWSVRSNQSILKEINPEYSLEGVMLKLWYSGHLMQRADSLEEIPMLRKIEGKRTGHRGWNWIDSIIDWMDMKHFNRQ